MHEYDVISTHLKSNTEINPTTFIFSSLVAALKDARLASRRNIDTGDVDHTIPHGYQGSWLGATGYFIFLDQVGNCYTRKTFKTKAGNRIKKALSCFSNLDEEQIDALFGLRCALMHDYGVFHVDERKHVGKHKRKHFIFRLAADNEEPLIRHAIKPWHGNITEKPDPEMQTTVNLLKFGNMAENVYNTLLREHSLGQLKINPELGAETLFRRYTLSVKRS